MQSHTMISMRQSAPRCVPQAHVVPSSVEFRRGTALPKKAFCATRQHGRGTRLAVRAAGDDTIINLRPIIYTDSEKEDSRQYRRTVFDHGKWEAHRSTSRYRRHLVTIVGSRVVRGLAIPVLTIAGIATAVVLYEGSLEAGLLPPVFRTIAVNTKAAGGMTSFALSLLLVFRTNASYARWDEARKIWGGVVNRTRDLARQGFTFFRTETPEDRALVAAHERWCIAFPKALMSHLRKDVDLREELEGVLLPDELEKLLSCTHRPNYVARVLGVIVRNAQIPDPNVFRMGENITFFADACGACERIFKTPIPLSWTRHTSRFLMIWLASVPFSLYDTCKWATIPAAAMIAFLLLGIEEIGVSIEEPFSILPLEVITDTIKANILEMSDDLDEVEALVDVRQLTAGTGGNGYSKQLTGATSSVYASQK